ncbi:hypothetical protein E4U43_008253 [Claviceps pusilla]|uniref:Uncharacterized protein n=1 Tax=Claviceps pusilla TaxID=123648 RepID=A0A9P7NDE1_9HYPO|nr:hypothetical protein E4U43_008253 [Claviceps pusilla]
MPRPKRARRAPPEKKAKTSAGPAATTTDDEHHEHLDDQRGRTRGRTRATRSAVARNSLAEHDALRAARERRDAALDRLANEDPTVTSGPEDNVEGRGRRRSSVETETDRRRVIAATPPLATGRDVSGLDLADDSVFGDLGDSFADGHVPEAPPSGASSTATLSHLRTRQRSRQSSMIGRHDPPIRPSSRGGNSYTPGVSSSFNIGVFRRRAREPSILGGSRRAQSRTGSVAGSVTSSRAGSVAGGSELGELESEGEELAPGAESTPSKSRRQSRRSASQTQNQKQLEGKQPSPSASASPSPSPCPSPSPEPRRRSTRKRKSDDDAATAQSERVARRAKVGRVEANGGLVIDSDSELSDVPSPPTGPNARLARPVTPVIDMDEITAPPASSDSEADDNAIWPDIHTLAKRRRRPSVTTPLRNNGDNFSDISTPPSLTHSPNLATNTANTRGRSATKQQRQRQGQNQNQRSPKITTADLTSLLPKRTYKRTRADDFDIDSDGRANSPDGESSSSSSSDGEQDHDPWSRTPPQFHSRPRGRPRKVPPAPGSSRPPNTVLKQRRVPERAGAGTTVRRSGRTTNKTYRTSENKENDDEDDDDDDDESDAERRENSHFQPLPDDTFDESAVVPDVQNTEELLRATQKFIEVDQWELSYEEVAEASSPQGAR